MTDELEVLRGTRAAVDPPSARVRDAARARWSGAGSGLAPTADARGTGRARTTAFAGRVVMAGVVVTALVAGAWVVTRQRVRSVRPLHVLTVTSLPTAAATDPQVFLLVGSDSRAFVQNGTQAQAFGDPTSNAGARSDSIILVRVDPGTGQTLVVSIPRDLLVDIPGCGASKINAAFDGQQTCGTDHGGAGLLVATITRDLGVPVNHVIEVQFPQFAALTSELGGLRIDFPQAARDTDTGLNEPAGCTTLNGDQALAFVRSRHLEWLGTTGRWTEDPTGDLGRMAREQLALRELAAAAQARAGTDPRPLLEALFAHVSVDAGFTADDALRYFAALRDGHTITTTLPTEQTVLDNGEQVLARTPDAQRLLDALAGRATITPHDVPTPATDPEPTPTAC